MARFFGDCFSKGHTEHQTDSSDQWPNSEGEDEDNISQLDTPFSLPTTAKTRIESPSKEIVHEAEPHRKKHAIS
jgi:hypothetical protein